jgi:hypothetical protein
MLSYLPIALLGISATVASPVDKRTVDNTQPAGSNPILWCAAGITDPSQETSGFYGMVRGLVLAMTSNVLKT